jgi:hypothetical protein
MIDAGYPSERPISGFSQLSHTLEVIAWMGVRFGALGNGEILPRTIWFNRISVPASDPR